MANEKDTKIEKAQINFEQEMIDIQQAEKERKTYSAKGNKSQNKIHRRRIITGAIFCTLALIGVLSIISGVVKTGVKILDNTEEKKEYNTLLASLVVYDPLPFETPDQADQHLLKASSVWAAIMNEDMSVYETNEWGETLLPAADVDKYFAKLFGTQIKLTHGTFSDRDVDFEFVEEAQAYIIPTTSFPTGFEPQVEKIRSSFTERTVTVGYLSPQTSWADTGARTVSKYVDYIFEKQDSQWALVAIRESDMKVETNVSSDSTTTQQ